MLMEIEGDNGIEWQERALGCGRRTKIIAMRRSRARIDSLLSPEMRDASREIDRAYEELESGWGFILTGFLPPSFTRIRGGGNSEIDMEVIDSIKSRIDKLKKWENNCTPFLRDTVYSINQLHYTAKTYSEFKGITVGEVMMWYKEGLRVYVKLAGWE